MLTRTLTLIFTFALTFTLTLIFTLTLTFTLILTLTFALTCPKPMSYPNPGADLNPNRRVPAVVLSSLRALRGPHGHRMGFRPAYALHDGGPALGPSGRAGLAQLALTIA